ncbi:anion permease [Dermabacteraceae bacterium P13264]
MLALGVFLALAFTVCNGFHDASNAVATSIVTKALRERTALVMAAVLNFLGTCLAFGIVLASGSSLLHFASFAVPGGADATGLLLICCAITAAICWNLLTWWWGMPSSSSHALLAALWGACLVSDRNLLEPIAPLALVIPLLVLPMLAAAMALGGLHLFARFAEALSLTPRQLRLLQTMSAGAVAAGHGLQDGLRCTALLAAVLLLSGVEADFSAPAALAAAFAIGGGTLLGGRRIIRTIGRRLSDLSTPQGLAAESATAVLLYGTSILPGFPASTTHVLTASVAGAGLAAGPGSLRWPLLGKIILTWLATPLFCAALAACLTSLFVR